MKLLPALYELAKMKFKLFATEHTSDFMRENGIVCEKVYKIGTKKEPSVGSLLDNDGIDLIINIPTRNFGREATDGYIIRRKAVDLNIPLITNRQLAESFIVAFSEMKPGQLKSESVDRYRDKSA